MISAGYKSAYQQGYSDAMRDFKKKTKTDVLDKIRAEIEGELEQDNHSFYRAALEDVLKIIDKYRGE